MNNWLTHDRPGDFVLPPGVYDLSAGITLAPAANRVGGRIVGYGAVLNMTGTDNYGLTVDTTVNSKVWRNLTIEGVAFTGCGLRLRSGLSGSSLYGWALRNVDPEGFDGHGIWIDGTFEGTLYDCHPVAAADNTTGDCIHADHGVGNVSSLDVYGGSTRNGKRGLFANAVDLDVFGGTYLEAKEEGVRSQSMTGGVISGVHVENCWTSAVDQTSANAGVLVTGRGTVDNVRAVTNAKMKWGVRVYANPSCMIRGGAGSGLVEFAKVEGPVGTNVLLDAVPGYDASTYDGTVTARAIG